MQNTPPPSRSQAAQTQQDAVEAKHRRHAEAAAIVLPIPPFPRWMDYHPSTISRGWVKHHGGDIGHMAIQELGCGIGWCFAVLGWLGHYVVHRRSVAAAEKHLAGE